MSLKKTIVHFVRHGEVENPQGIRYGRLPGFHLSSEGRRQAQAAGLWLLRRPLVAIYTSPLERTQQTATLLGLAHPHVDICLDDRILEIKTPARLQGKSRDAAFYYPTTSSPDSETADELFARLWAFTEEKIIKHQGKECVAVSHGDPIGLFVSRLLDPQSEVIRDPYPSYASIHSLVFSGLELQSVWYQPTP